MNIIHHNFQQTYISNSNEQMPLADNEVHIWWVKNINESKKVNPFRQYLSYDENTRAERYVFAGVKNRFINSRAVLRVLLGKYTCNHPKEIIFKYGKNGKPYLAQQYEPGEAKHLSFNLSHSFDWAIIALTLNRQIGVDLEKIRRIEDMNNIAKQYFSNLEFQKYMILKHQARLRAFFDCWTRKEAYLKAIGNGFSFSFKDFTVSLAPDDKPALLQNNKNPSDPSRWEFEQFYSENNFTAALTYSKN